MATFLLINGYPGVGKLTVANELAKLFSNAKVFNNHLLIDAAAALFRRSDPEYQPLRKELRRVVLSSLTASHNTRGVTWIFTEQQSSSPGGSATVKEYLDTARNMGSPFISVVLSCSLEENAERITSGDRGSRTTKLTDLAVLEHIRNTEDVFHFGEAAQLELDIDVTTQSASEAAKEIFEKVEPVVLQGGNITSDTTTPATKTPTKVTFNDIPGFKHVFIADYARQSHPEVKSLLCWVKGRIRHHGRLLFVDVVDSTGCMQAVVTKDKTDGDWSKLVSLPPESALQVTGALIATSSSSSGGSDTLELHASHVSIISQATKTIAPPIRPSNPSILSSSNTHLVLSSRHLYLRNPYLSQLQVFRSHLFFLMRCWFEKHRFLDVSTPIITPTILYEPPSAIHVANLKNTKPLFLSQCAGFYLEAAAQAHERVYNLGPSFRNESRSNRHLMEYWHIKAELCSGALDDIIQLVEVFLTDIIDDSRIVQRDTTDLLQTPRFESLSPPFPRITYREAVARLRAEGVPIQFGASISKDNEKRLTEMHGSGVPVWLMHKPREIEPFPYRIHPTDDALTLTADLIAPDGFGEICGVAEKIFDLDELDMRLKEKGKDILVASEYAWVREMREFGMTPHTAFGMGFERILRWLVGVEHVKDTIPFPRIFGRHPVP